MPKVLLYDHKLLLLQDLSSGPVNASGSQGLGGEGLEV